MTSNFVHLHVHSEYSLLDGLGNVVDLAAQAAKHNQSALALTDHGVMHGAVEFFRACKDHEVKPIIGVEGYLTPYGRKMTDRDPHHDRVRHHVLLLAQNMRGYQNLLKISAASQLEGYYYKPRIDADFLAAHSEGLICTSGCMAAEVPHLLNNEDNPAANETLARDRLRWYLDVFGRDRFYIELQEHSIPALTQINKKLFAWAKPHDLQLLVTNDVHYPSAADAASHDALLCIQTSALLNEQKRLKFSDTGYYLKSEEEMRAAFRKMADLPPSAFTNSIKIAEMCEVDLEDNSYHLPDLPPGIMPPGYDYKSFLRHLTDEGLKRRYGSRADSQTVQARKELELGIISTMNFDVYFLIVWDLCEFARGENIWWNVRGSGAGSIVAYALGITLIDPLKNQLIFERFLNPGRVSMPDFDLDYPDDQRERLIRYTIDQYGTDHVAQIVSFGRMKARAAVRDVGRVQAIELDEVDKIAKLIPAIPGKPITIDKTLEEGNEFYSAELKQRYEQEPQVKALIDQARSLEGTARHASIHAAAVIVTDKPLIDYVPLMRPQGSVITKSVTQFEFPVCESIGLLKIDFLGLSTLTIMRQAAELIKKRHNTEYNLDNIPVEDKKAFDLLASGNVTGIFQVEGAGMRRILTDMRPSKFDHIIAILALYRPGPLQYIPNYIARMHGQEEVVYRHPLLEPILKDTYGICVSGDAIVADARTGRRYRLDEVGSLSDMVIQGVDTAWRPATGRVVRWIDSGQKFVYRLTLRNGASIKVTPEHRLLTETGWQPLSALHLGHYIATPPILFGPNQEDSQQIDRRRLRVLAYLLADGRLASLSAVDFVNQEAVLLQEYQGGGFDQKRGGPRIGLRSQEKYIPAFVFELNQTDLAFFVASLWDCDGYMGRKLCHYKTISTRLAKDVQTLLLRLGFPSTLYKSEIKNPTAEDPARCGYLVTVYDTRRFAALLEPFMLSKKRQTGRRSDFSQEVDSLPDCSRREIMKTYEIDRQHVYAKARSRERISASVVGPKTKALAMPETKGINWQEIVSIEPVGLEPVYDLTVEGLHSFVANNIVVHNCVYQEQIMRIATDLAGYTASEADIMRKAVAKKKEKDLLKHREKMVEGGKKQNISEEIILDIFRDIEAFARYGFPKGHAADYAVITCQTAYLKAHYPVEYMAALLTVEHSNTEKIGLLLEESRTLGINILPPNVNHSSYGFIIEDNEGKSFIRFGLGAIKNVGEGPIEAILQGRGDQTFTDIDDFCQRVDLRSVGKRALESLIKAKALGDFADAAVLLNVMDQMLRLSGNDHQAASVGQMSLFDMDGIERVQTSSILEPLPQVEAIPRQEQLRWEKDLIGTYISDHPIQPHMAEIKASTTCSCGDLEVLRHDRQVRVAGLITNVKTTTTKKGDLMAFVEIEDLSASLEIIVFPRTYVESKDMLQEGELILISGKVDGKDLERPKILANEISKELTTVRPVEAEEANGPYIAERAGGYFVEDEDEDEMIRPDLPNNLNESALVSPNITNGKGVHSSPSLESQSLIELPSAPPPLSSETPEDIPDTQPESPLVRPAQIKSVEINLQRTNNLDQDITCLRKIFDLLQNHPGQTGFYLVISKNDARIPIEYPFGITYNSTLANELKALLGENRVRILD